MAFNCDYLLAYLAQLGINTTTIEHPPLRTVEESKSLRPEIEGGHVKNLFLKDKRKNYWLLTALESTIIDLKQTAQLLEAYKFSFANPDELMQFLGIIPGAVSPFAVINDTDKLVSVVLDERMVEVSPLNFHPLQNDRTTTITTPDFLNFLKATDHAPRIVRLPG
jgi:Ala-tRNA(Pro) deacylase